MKGDAIYRRGAAAELAVTAARLEAIAAAPRPERFSAEADALAFEVAEAEMRMGAILLGAAFRGALDPELARAMIQAASKFAKDDPIGPWHALDVAVEWAAARWPDLVNWRADYLGASERQIAAAGRLYALILEDAQGVPADLLRPMPLAEIGRILSMTRDNVRRLLDDAGLRTVGGNRQLWTVDLARVDPSFRKKLMASVAKTRAKS